MYDRVLHPTDGSQGADVATERAVEFAAAVDAAIHALFVVDTGAIQATDAYATSNDESTVEALESEGRERIERVRERARSEGVEVTSEVVRGRPASAITEAARSGDVIVMGTHGRTGLDRYLIGSTTENVVRTANVPVMTIPMDAVADAD